MNTAELLSSLCAVDAVSGSEEAIRQAIMDQVRDYCSCSVDTRGNLICVKEGKRQPKSTVVLFAHMDEVGFAVTGVDSEGFLRFSTVGPVDSRMVIGKRLRLPSGQVAIVGTKPIHVQSKQEQDTPLTVREMYLDLGAVDKEDALSCVALGDCAAYFCETRLFGDGRIKAKALDNRAGCACLIQLLQQEAEVGFTAVFTVCKECGKSGAENAAFALKPDVAIVVDCAEAADVSGVGELDQGLCQGKGPALSFQDGRCILDKALFRQGLSLAEKNGIPCQIKTSTTGDSEAAAVSTAGAGARTMLLSLPIRYSHSSAEVLKLSDVEDCTKLLGCLVQELA